MFNRRKTDKTDVELVLEALASAGIELSDNEEENKPYGNKLLLECSDGSSVLIDENFNMFPDYFDVYTSNFYNELIINYEHCDSIITDKWEDDKSDSSFAFIKSPSCDNFFVATINPAA